MKVKIFENSNETWLEGDVNKFYEENPNIKIFNIAYAASVDNHMRTYTMAITYKEE